MRTGLEKRIGFDSVRRAYWKTHPKFCRRCLCEAPIHLHHIIPVVECETADNSDENLMPLCASCHKEYHAHWDREDKDPHETINEFINTPPSLFYTMLLKDYSGTEIGKINEQFKVVKNVLTEMKEQAFYEDMGEKK